MPEDPVQQPLLWLDAARELRGRMTFHACIDDPAFEPMPADEIDSTVDRVIRAMSVPAGGFIGTINNMIDPKVPAEKVDAAWGRTGGSHGSAGFRLRYPEPPEAESLNRGAIRAAGAAERHPSPPVRRGSSGRHPFRRSLFAFL
jgi:hypothetical protein